MTRLALYTAVVLATLAVLIVLWQFRSVLLLLVISLALAATLRPGFEFLAAHGLPAPLARVFVYAAVLLAIGLAIYALSSPLTRESGLLGNYLLVVYTRFQQQWSAGSSFQQAVAAILPAPETFPAGLSEIVGVSVAEALFGVTTNLVSVVAGLGIIVVLSLYWSADRNHFERLWLSVLPASQRIEARSIWRTTESSMGADLRSELIQLLLAFILLAVGFRVIGLAFPILAAVVAAVAWLIPLAGFLISLGAALLFGLASGSWALGLGALLYTTLVLFFLEFIVEPRFFKRRQFSGLLIFFMMLVLVQAYGLVGFVVAPPVAVAIQVLLSYISRAIRRPQTAAVQIDALEEKLAEVRAAYDREAGDGMRPELGSLIMRLEELIAQARESSLMTNR